MCLIFNLSGPCKLLCLLCFIASGTCEVVSVMWYPCMLCVALLMCLFVLCVACLTVFDSICELFGETICNGFGCSCYFVRGELGFLNCDDVCMCVVNKQFELLEFVSESIYVDLQYDEISLTFTAGYVCLCGVGSPVIVPGVFERLS